MALTAKQIAITITSSFNDAGTKAAKAAMGELAAQVKNIQAQAAANVRAQSPASLSKLTSKLDSALLRETRENITAHKNLLSLTKQLDKSLAKEGATASQAAGGFHKLRSAMSNVGGGLKNITGGFGGLGNAIKSVLMPINLFDSIMGRVTVGLLTWRLWQGAAEAFTQAVDAIVGGTARMQVAVNTFTALAKGSQTVGQTYVDIVRQIAGETGQNVDQMLADTKRLPTQVGQNFQAFEQLTKQALVLGMIDPLQGTQGAMVALTNAMEGTSAGFRSLLMRFEIGTMEQVKRILEETSDPLEAINKLLEEAGINVDEFIEAQMNTLPVAWQGIVNTVREFLRLLGEPAINEFTKTVVSLRDWLLENRAAVEGLARAIGDQLLGTFLQVKQFIRDTFFGGQEVTPAMLFGGLMNAITGFIEWLLQAIEVVMNVLAGLAEGIVSVAEAIAGVFGGKTSKAGQAMGQLGKQAGALGRAMTGEQVASQHEDVPLRDIAESAAAAAAAIAKVVTKPIGEIRAALLGVKEGGKETIEQFVKGMVEGLSAADLEKLGKDILDSVLDLEAQELQQEKAIDNLEDWVDQAEKEVQAARDKLKLFDLATEDIPERFTRARRRQLELEVMAAEKEQRRRKEALEIAKEQLAATKEQLAAQRQVLSLIEQQLKDVEEAGGGGGIDKGFVPPSIDTETFKRQVEEFRRQFGDQIAPIFDRIRERVTNILEAAGRLKTALGEIFSGIGNIISSADRILSSLSGGWESLDPGLRTFLLALVGFSLLKNVLPVVLSLSFQLASAAIAGAAGPAAAGAGKLLGWIIATLGGASLAALSLPAAIAILITMVWLGREELVKWITGERQLELGVVVIAKMTEGINKLLNFLGFDYQIDASGVLQPIVDELDRVNRDVEQEGVLDTIASWFTGERQSRLAGQVEDAVKNAIWTPITTWATDTYNEVVGNSIIPDMLNEIVNVFTAFPGRLQSPLITMRETIMAEMTILKTEWISDWDQMAAAVERTMGLQAKAREASLNRTTREAGQSVSKAIRQVATRQSQPVNLNLDAKETRRLMREGVYKGMMEIMPGEGSV